MIIGIFGFGAVLLGIFVKQPNVTTVGFGLIGLDIVFELSTLSTNLRIQIKNTRILLTKILERMKK